MVADSWERGKETGEGSKMVAGSRSWDGDTHTQRRAENGVRELVDWEKERGGLQMVAACWPGAPKW